jgi:hypothetical protein
LWKIPIFGFLFNPVSKIDNSTQHTQQSSGAQLFIPDTDFKKWNGRSQAHSFVPIYRPQKSCAPERLVDFGKNVFQILISLFLGLDF